MNRKLRAAFLVCLLIFPTFFCNSAELPENWMDSPQYQRIVNITALPEHSYDDDNEVERVSPSKRTIITKLFNRRTITRQLEKPYYLVKTDKYSWDQKAN